MPAAHPHCRRRHWGEPDTVEQRPRSVTVGGQRLGSRGAALVPGAGHVDVGPDPDESADVLSPTPAVLGHVVKWRAAHPRARHRRQLVDERSSFVD